jgi:hypothetical protein
MNGIMTLSGAWHKLREDPVLRFLVVSLSFYGMSTFEGPMMSIKTVNSLSHYTDWTIGHVHSGALGWVGLVSMGSLYFLIPRLFSNKTTMYSQKAVELHFWIATVGIVLYIAVHLRRKRQGDLAVLRAAPGGRRTLSIGHADHAVEHAQDRERGQSRRRADPCCPCPRLRRPPWNMQTPVACTTRSKPTTS